MDGTRRIPAVNAGEMRLVDRIAAGKFQFRVLQMMENAGRILAHHAVQMLGEAEGGIAILVGPGGNGGGGFSCARHLHNRGFRSEILRAQPAALLQGPAASQWRTLSAAGVHAHPDARAGELIQNSSLVIDALLGYSLSSAPHGRIKELIGLCNAHAAAVLSLDLPSGLDATSGKRPGAAIHADRTLTLALPKIGLRGIEGDLYLANFGIPPELYGQLDLQIPQLFRERDWEPLDPAAVG